MFLAHFLVLFGTGSQHTEWKLLPLALLVVRECANVSMGILFLRIVFKIDQRKGLKTSPGHPSDFWNGFWQNQTGERGTPNPC